MIMIKDGNTLMKIPHGGQKMNFICKIKREYLYEFRKDKYIVNNNNLAVETFGLTKAYKGVFAVDNINLKVPRGSICGFLGKNGAGKTTTIKMVTGLIRPTAGDYAVMGTQKENLTKGVKSVGYLPDVPDFYGYMTGGEFLHLCGKLCGIPEK